MQPKGQLLNFRIDPELRTQFAKAAEEQNRPVAEVLRQLMRAYVAAAEKKRLAAEARRQSELIAQSPDEAEVMRWIEDVAGSEKRR
jgi:antitoxin component of RelBE/YafQ-DinJ toxin-antitoxin module